MKKYNLSKLEWDSSFFHVECGKIILYDILSNFDWDDLSTLIYNFDLLYIEDKSCSISNNTYLAKLSNSFIVDINIQFEKRNLSRLEVSKEIKIIESMPPLDDLFNIANFQYSRFIEDSKLKLLGGDKVYEEWIKNSYLKKGKYFSIFEKNNVILGFVLFSFTNKTCIIELIAVDKNARGIGIGKKLFMSVINFASTYGASCIKVGTQLKNLSAINFYHSLGCIQTESSIMYHFWNEKK